ncbi:MAG: hypothetical protein ABIS01_04600 [Ferruginibacter sp.]
MNKNDHINKSVDDALNSINDINRASPKAFLLTRINNRLNQPSQNVWEKAGWFIGRPVFAIPVLAMVITVNFMVIVLNRPDPVKVSTEQFAQGTADDFSFTVSSIYDIENTEP